MKTMPKKTIVDQELKNELYEWLKCEDRVIFGMKMLKKDYPNFSKEQLIELIKEELMKEDDVVSGVILNAEKLGKITLYRAMLISDFQKFSKWIKSGESCFEGFIGVGNSWTWDFAHAKVYQHYHEGKIYILKSIADFKDIDIDMTLFEYHADYDFDDYENEIRLFPESKVLLESILDDKGNVIEKFNPAISIEV